MLPFVSLSTTLLLALLVVASPVEVRDSPVTLPIARKLNLEGGIINVLQQDRARAAAFKGRSQGSVDRRSGSTSIINSPSVYIAKVGVGSPPTTYDLVVDTGSSNTWVGANISYVKTKTSINTGKHVSVRYGSGSFNGTEYNDTVTLGNGLTITNQSIGVAHASTGFTGFDGILGLGPIDLTEDNLPNDPLATIPTVTQNLYFQKVISEMIVSISFEPTNSQEITNGELTFGATDSTKYTGNIAYVPTTATYPASTFWGFNQTITYGTKTILSNTAGIVDTGTTFILLATDALSVYQSVTGATTDDTTGLLSITLAQYNALENLNFKIGSNTYVLTPNGQIWPRSLNTYIGGSSSSIYLVVADLDAPSGYGLDFINGYTFLERFYSVYNTPSSLIGFATTPHTDATTN